MKVRPRHYLMLAALVLLFIASGYDPAQGWEQPARTATATRILCNDDPCDTTTTEPEPSPTTTFTTTTLPPPTITTVPSTTLPASPTTSTTTTVPVTPTTATSDTAPPSTTTISPAPIGGVPAGGGAMAPPPPIDWAAYAFLAGAVILGAFGAWTLFRK